MQRKTEEIRNELTDQIDKIQEIKDLQTELGPLQTAWQSYLSKLERRRMLIKAWKDIIRSLSQHERRPMAA